MANSPGNAFASLPVAPCHIFKFPNELVAETISWLSHPAHILSLASTCRKFYSILKDPKSAYVWRHARERFVFVKSYVKDTGPPAQPDDPKSGTWLEFVQIPGTGDRMRLIVVTAPVPPPFEGQSEFDFARMVFGRKRCTKCQQVNPGMPYSLLIPISECRDCRTKELAIGSFMTSAEVWSDYSKRTGIVASGDTADIINQLWHALPNDNINPRSHETYVMRASWEQLVGRFLDVKKTGQSSMIKQFLQGTVKAITEKTMTSNKHAKELNRWGREYIAHVAVMEAGVHSISETFAVSQGLSIADMKKAPAYVHAVAIAKRQYTMDIFPLLTPVLSDVTSQTLRIRANRISTSTNGAQKTRRKEIEAMYKQFPFPNKIKPTLEVFRAFPILQAYQRGISPDGVLSNSDYIHSERPPYMGVTIVSSSNRVSVQQDLKTTAVLDLVGVSVQQWREVAMIGARKLLGFGHFKRAGGRKRNKKGKGKKKDDTAMVVDTTEPNTKQDGTLPLAPASDAPMDVDSRGAGSDDKGTPKWHSMPGKLDPEMRVTSWFVCTRCTNMDPGYKRMRVLDFRGLCTHECWQKDWNKARRKNWNIECFVLAPRAVDTANKMLEILGLDAEDPSVTTHCFKGWWTCKNCPALMNAMVWEDLIRHCQRHKNQDIAQISDEDARGRRKILNHEKRLTIADLLKYEADARTKQLACVHCRASSEDVVLPAKSHKVEKIMDIHGIRQHMKAKHRVADCRNEDYYYVAEDKVQRPSTEIQATEVTKPEEAKANHGHSTS